jgi:hypothetical protein
MSKTTKTLAWILAVAGIATVGLVGCNSEPETEVVVPIDKPEEPVIVLKPKKPKALHTETPEAWAEDGWTAIRDGKPKPLVDLGAALPDTCKLRASFLDYRGKTADHYFKYVKKDGNGVAEGPLGKVLLKKGELSLEITKVKLAANDPTWRLAWLLEGPHDGKKKSCSDAVDGGDNTQWSKYAGDEDGVPSEFIQLALAEDVTVRVWDEDDKEVSGVIQMSFYVQQAE